MTTFLLLRHGTIPTLGTLVAGRAPDVHLTEEGREQASGLALRLSPLPVVAIYSSPLERARETAAPLAERLGLEVRLLPEIVEVDFGDWTGRRFDEVVPLPEWRLWKVFRSGARIPGGESMIEVQARVIGCLDSLRRSHPGQVVALVSHGDVIRSALAFYLGVSLDLFTRIEISPASVSILAIGGRRVAILGMNLTETLPELGPPV